MYSKKIIIGTRGSDLALWQANTVKAQLESLGLIAELNIIKTQGDAIQHLSFEKMEGKGFFTKEIEDALLAGQIDLAVHSHKDLETNQPEGLCVAAVSMRADSRELMVMHKEALDPDQIYSLKLNATIGTSSARRKAQIIHHRKDLVIKDLRGNVPTRIQKLRDRQYDAIVLAKAGVDRLQLDLSEFASFAVDAKLFVPAPAQGVLALQCRTADIDLIKAIQPLHHRETESLIRIERTVLNKLHGGCQLPLGVHAYRVSENTIQADVAYAEAWNKPLHTFSISSDSGEELIDLILSEIANK